MEHIGPFGGCPVTITHFFTDGVIVPMMQRLHRFKLPQVPFDDVCVYQVIRYMRYTASSCRRSRLMCVFRLRYILFIGIRLQCVSFLVYVFLLCGF